MPEERNLPSTLCFRAEVSLRDAQKMIGLIDLKRW